MSVMSKAFLSVGGMRTSAHFFEELTRFMNGHKKRK